VQVGETFILTIEQCIPYLDSHYFSPYNMPAMAKLTAKYQLTLPKAVAQRAGLKPGDDVDCEPANEMIRIRRKAESRMQPYSKTDRLVLFDLATERQTDRQRSSPGGDEIPRGWTRDELYER
jgi:AbrB family looped-hinge helix DNA binding protein